MVKKETRKVVFEGELTRIGGQWAIQEPAEKWATDAVLPGRSFAIEAELAGFEGKLVRITIEDV